MDQPNKRKPWYRPRNILLAIFGFIIVLVVYLVVETLHVYHGTSNPIHDYVAEFQVEARKVAGITDWDEDANRETWNDLLTLLQTAELTILQFEADWIEAHPEAADNERFPYDESVDFDYVLLGDSIPDNVQREREAIDGLREAGVFEQLAAFARRAPAFDTRRVNGPLFGKIMPELAQARALVTAREASMRIALLDGDFEGVARGFDEMMAVGQTLAYQPALISYLVGIAIQWGVLGEMRAELLEAEFPPDTCRAILQTLDNRPFPPASLGLEGERALFRDTIQWYFSDDGTGNGYLLPGYSRMTASYGDRLTPPGRLAEAFVGRFLLADRQETLRKYDDLLDRVIAESEERLSDRSQTEADLVGELEALPYRHLMVKMLLPGLVRSSSASETFRIQYEGTRIVAGLELHRALHGQYPASLDQLVPEVFAKVPTDPLHGKPFGYRLVEDDPHGRAYLLYSIGFDETDDDGRELGRDVHPYEEMAAIIDRTAEGVDYVINRPRRVPYER